MKQKNETLPPDTVLVHFAGDVKPWHPWCDNDGRKIYEKYRDVSLWSDFAYKPRDYQEQRLMGKAMRRKGQYLAATAYYLKYVRDKAKRFLNKNARAKK